MQRKTPTTVGMIDVLQGVAMFISRVSSRSSLHTMALCAHRHPGSNILHVPLRVQRAPHASGRRSVSPTSVHWRYRAQRNDLMQSALGNLVI